MDYYDYYLEAYEAVLGGMVGEYEMETEAEDGTRSFETRYGLKAFSPIARGFDYSDYDDFGSSRSYGYKRPHLGGISTAAGASESAALIKSVTTTMHTFARISLMHWI